MRLLNSLAFSDKDETKMNKLMRTPELWMNEGLGRDLVTIVKHCLEFYREAKLSCVVTFIFVRTDYKQRPSRYSVTLSYRHRKYQSVGRSVYPSMLRQH